MKEENPAYKKAAFTVIDEIKDPHIADQYDYFLVPTFYINEEKVHEGIASKDIIKDIFEKAVSSDSKP